MTDLSTTAGKLADLQARLAETVAPAGQDAVDAVHQAGRLTARERIISLVDEGSFAEVDALAKHRVKDPRMKDDRPVTDGVVTGFATVDGRKVCVVSQDATVFSGQLGEVHGEKIVKIQKLALKSGTPLIGFYEGAGPRPAENVAALSFYSQILAGSETVSGVVPQVAVLSGENSGAHALLSSLADITVMVDGSTLAFGESAAHAEEATDCAAHAKAGHADLVAADDADSVTKVREVLAYLPSNNRAEAPRTPGATISGPVAEHVTKASTDLDVILPDDSTADFDMAEIISRLVDEGVFLELRASFAANLITAFARVEGRSVGVVANQPKVNSGLLDGDAAEKAAQFIRLCDAFNIPVLTLVDIPGFTAAENDGGAIIRRVAKLAYAYAEASVGLVTVTVRHATGAAYAVMGAKDLGVDLVYAWPTAEIAVPEAEEDRDPISAAPYLAAERGLVDAVIAPSETRTQLIEALRLLDRKVLYPAQRKHGTMPL